MTIILGGDSLNKNIHIKEQDARNPFFPKIQDIFKAATMSGATYILSMEHGALMPPLYVKWEIRYSHSHIMEVEHCLSL